MSKAIKKLFKNIPLIRRISETVDNRPTRDEFVIDALKRIPAGSFLLDAGCGDQLYRQYCDHLNYKAQDLGKFEVDLTPAMNTYTEKYAYGKIDYVGDIWNIDERDGTFDAILCTEVLEHIAYPIETIKEFSRLLKPGGKLILTAPSNCLRHMDPFYFYSGFSNWWYEQILSEHGFRIDKMDQVGDYYSWMRSGVKRTMVVNPNVFEKMILWPAFIYFSLKNKTPESAAALCEGYHIIATKSSDKENKKE